MRLSSTRCGEKKTISSCVIIPSPVRMIQDSSLDLTPENSKSTGPSELCTTHIQSPSVQNRRLQDLASLMYKDKYGLVPSLKSSNIT